jgi:plasmid segregation protein ParM
MTKLRDYNMNGTIILGVDAGYGNYGVSRSIEIWGVETLT